MRNVLVREIHGQIHEKKVNISLVFPDLLRAFIMPMCLMSLYQDMEFSIWPQSTFQEASLGSNVLKNSSLGNMERLLGGDTLWFGYRYRIFCHFYIPIKILTNSFI